MHGPSRNDDERSAEVIGRSDNEIRELLLEEASLDAVCRGIRLRIGRFSAALSTFLDRRRWCTSLTSRCF